MEDAKEHLFTAGKNAQYDHKVRIEKLQGVQEQVDTMVNAQDTPAMIMKVLKPLLDCLCTQLGCNRSDVVKKAARTAVKIAEAAHSHPDFDQYALPVFDALIDLSGSTAGKFLPNIAVKTMKDILMHCPDAFQCLTKVANEAIAIEDRGPPNRVRCLEVIKGALELWEDKDLSGFDPAPIYNAVLKGCSDSKAANRQAARDAFSPFETLWPDLAKKLMKALTEENYRLTHRLCTDYPELDKHLSPTHMAQVFPRREFS